MSKGQLEKLQEKKYYRANELKDLLSCGLSTIWLWSKQGKITPIKLSERVTVFSIDEVNKVFNLNNEVL